MNINSQYVKHSRQNIISVHVNRTIITVILWKIVYKMLLIIKKHNISAVLPFMVSNLQFWGWLGDSVLITHWNKELQVTFVTVKSYFIKHLCKKLRARFLYAYIYILVALIMALKCV